MAKKYSPPIEALRTIASKRDWNAIKLFARPLTNNGILPQDLTAGVVANLFTYEVGRGISVILAHTRVNQFVRAINSIGASHLELRLPRLDRLPNTLDMRKAEWTRFPDGVEEEVNPFIASLPLKHRDQHRNNILNCSLLLLKAGVSFTRLRDFLSPDNLRTIVRGFAPIKKTCSSRISALGTLTRLAEWREDDRALDDIAALRKRIAPHRSVMDARDLTLLARYHHKAGLKQLTMRTKTHLINLETKGVTNARLLRAQTAVFIVISIFSLDSVENIRDYRIVIAGDGISVMDKGGAVVDADWPESLRAFIERYYRIVCAHFGHPIESLFIAEDGTIRNLRSFLTTVNRLLRLEFDVLLPAHAVRRIGFLELLWDDVSPRIIAGKAKMKSHEDFERYYRPLINNIKMLRSAGPRDTIKEMHP